MRRLSAVIVLPLALLLNAARAQTVLLGHLEGNLYVAPSGAFEVPIPVLPGLGGTVTDTASVVTFKDDFNTHISLAAFPQDATQRWLLSTSGPRDYLKEFFEKYVVRDFAQNYKNVRVETDARFLPGMLDGSFIAFVLLPGGSMFTTRAGLVALDAPPPVAKRGNMLFVRNGYIFVISTELAERVTEGSAYHKTADEEDKILRDRLVAFAKSITFLKSAPLP